MKIALTSKGEDLDSEMSSVFGRCQNFVIAEVEDGEISESKPLENSAGNQSSGAGPAAAQLVGDEGVDKLISGGMGPKAFSALEQWDIEVYEGVEGTLKKNIEKLSSGKLEKVESPTGPAHKGMK